MSGLLGKSKPAPEPDPLPPQTPEEVTDLSRRGFLSKEKRRKGRSSTILNPWTSKSGGWLTGKTGKKTLTGE
jgi:hypothetical protein